MADIALAFLWHQHQPYYPDDVTGENPMPWVRLHGVKDYYGMAMHLLEFPEMRCTINLVPSLLLQLLAYTEGRATDRFFQISRLPVDSLAESDCLFLLDNFFMANPDTMIRPWPRFAELYQRRALGKNTAREALRRYSERDFRDLQVWFNLAWVHPLAGDRFPLLRELMQKSRYFTETDKQQLLDIHLEILKLVLPLHRQLVERGQVELTTTPFYHPILPLLLDKKSAREAMPEVRLPRATGGYPEDAVVHVSRAVEQHARLFGQAPRGMWPAEGSVCQAMIPLLAQHGISWIATDEEILNHSTHGAVSRDGKGCVQNPERMYRAYKAVEAGQEVAVVFRDHALSDLIGFHYQRSEPAAAADDFLRHLQAIGSTLAPGSEPALVPVILDGENCWEHYAGGGVAFLRALYERCTRTPGIQPVQLGEYLERHPPRDVLPHLFAGSWINHNFAIWIGHEEDNTAWDALHRTREFLKDREARRDDNETTANRAAAGSPVQQAWQELYIAEGSDWFWWYGDDHSSAQDELFDYLFRKHLQNVYLLLGEKPPPELAQPICRRMQRSLHTLPRAFLEVKIDGRLTFFEWVNAGHYLCQNQRGTMAMASRGVFKDIYFGFNAHALLVRIDCVGPARQVLTDYEVVRVSFLEPAGCELCIYPARTGRSLSARLVRQGQELAAPGLEVGIDQIAEFALPLAALGLKVDQPLQFYVEVQQQEQSRDRAPREGAIHLTCPSPDFEQIMWDVL